MVFNFKAFIGDEEVGVLGIRPVKAREVCSIGPPRKSHGLPIRIWVAVKGDASA